MVYGYIYLITNNINSKQYIGQTRRNINLRWKEHIRGSKNNINNQYICNAIAKYGQSNFTIEELVKIKCLTEEELINKLNELERSYISEYNTIKPNGYNMSIGGGFSPNTYAEKPVIQYDENFNKLNVFKSVAEASRKTNIQQSDISKCCLNINKSAGGFFWCFEGEKIDKNLKTKNKKVFQYTLDGIIIGEFLSITEASRITNINIANISTCCNYKVKSAGGYLWSFDKKDIIKYNPKSIKSVVQYDLNKNILSKFKSLTEASIKTNININSIISCCKNRRKTAGGFIWEYE